MLVWIFFFEDNGRTIADDEPQLTDDEDNNARDVSSMEQDRSNPEQQKKRRRTANFQNITSSSTIAKTAANGHHDDERITPLSSKIHINMPNRSFFLTMIFMLIELDSINSAGSAGNRRPIDYEWNTTNTTPILQQTSIETNASTELDRSTTSKQRFNIPSIHRGLVSNYDPTQSPLFSVGVRVSNMIMCLFNKNSINIQMSICHLN
jgi:hypothetical protein